MAQVPGTQLGQYRIVEQVGRGGMATVYKAFQPALNRYVAIKILPAFYAEDAQFLERFRQEAQTVSQLRHPNILAVFDFGEQDGTTYMVSEFLAGGTLEQFLGQSVPIPRVVELLEPIASALDYAHGRGTIHRDVKPSNILLTDDGTPVLSDFGLARIVGGSTRLTATGVGVGTPEYMAPEQAAGESTTAASDRYALGIVLYEMLTARTPFQAETPIAVALGHLHKPLPPPRSLNPDLPEVVEAILFKALAKEPAERFESAQAMIEALRAAATTPAGADAVAPAPLASSTRANRAVVPVTAPSITVPVPPVPAATAATATTTPPPAAARSRRPLLIGLSLLLLALAAGGGLFLVNQASSPAARSSAAQPATPPSIQLTTVAQPAIQPPGQAPAGQSAVATASPAGQAASPAAPSPAQLSGPLVKPGQARGERPSTERLLPSLAARLGGQLERDDFSSPNNGLFNAPVASLRGRVAYEDGSLLIEYSRRAPTEPIAMLTQANRPVSFSNGVIDVEAHLISENEQAGFNVGFRRNGADGYVIWLSPHRKFVQLNRLQGQTQTDLISTSSDAVQPDGNNRLTVVADGPSIQVYVNGQSALTASDESFTAGRITMSASLATGVTSGDVRAFFDDFRVLGLR